MASYAAVCSLKQTVRRLRNSFTISVLPPSQEILEFAFEEVESLQKYLDRLKSSSGKKVNIMNAQIREVASKLEDAILSHVSDQFLSQPEDQVLFINLEEVKQDLCSFVEMAKRIMEENKIEDLLAGEDDDISLTTDFGGKCSKMVGFSDLFSKIKDAMIRHPAFMLSCYVPYSVSLIGMAGIGKTALAMKIFEDPEILSHFERRAFVTIGPKYELREVMLDILSQLTPDVDEIHNKGVEEVGEYLLKTLSDKRCLIILDDIWDNSVYDLLLVVGYKTLLPCSSSRVLVTTRMNEVASNSIDGEVHPMPFLSKEESWELLHERVFGEESLCPIQLEKYGKKIAENCEGLPLAIVVVAGILSKNQKTPEYWKKTAEKKNSIFTDAFDQMFPVLFLSYKYLSQSSKPCFLYMGVFPPSSKISTSKLVQLLSAEGFLETYGRRDSERVSREHLERVVSNNLALVHQQSSRFETKTWSLHSANWHMCNKVASMEKFFILINNLLDSTSTEGIESQQRLCIHNNVLFGIKKVYNSMKSISTVRSLLCTGPHHQYPVPICFGLMFLRVLDALTARFYTFPIEALNLVQLRYLALTCNGNIPASISKLGSLEYFFVRRHLCIKPPGAWPYLPMEIWHMKELRHLQVMGSNLPDPCGVMLVNLLTLADLSADSCTTEILSGTPNLKKLGIQIELSPGVARRTLCFFDYLRLLPKLISFKCIIVNPEPRRSHVIACDLISFPRSLKKLNLSGLGCPWNYMSMIALVPNLEVLKLRLYAFQGPNWETKCTFAKLRNLLIEETDLVHWAADSCCFPSLQCLKVRHCYKLKGIPSRFGEIRVLNMIELVDCPSSVDSVKRMQKEHPHMKICVQSSWEDDKRKS